MINPNTQTTQQLINGTTSNNEAEMGGGAAPQGREPAKSLWPAWMDYQYSLTELAWFAIAMILIGMPLWFYVVEPSLASLLGGGR